ncbi:hypothetical protein Clacol_009894 [Clathrus columnatus]|uniref:Sister chromatid cohesion protein n=1 Tax=Clathrus columnatus TaxID=1419009 RepID=A0AAV5ALU1_9AGAM|nr:hypothetical protein Clacol_009894 [Clathrus columnatus]
MDRAWYHQQHRRQQDSQENAYFTDHPYVSQITPSSLPPPEQQTIFSNCSIPTAPANVLNSIETISMTSVTPPYLQDQYYSSHISPGYSEYSDNPSLTMSYSGMSGQPWEPTRVASVGVSAPHRPIPSSSSSWSLPPYFANPVSNDSIKHPPFIQSASSLSIALGDFSKNPPVRLSSESRSSSSVYQHNMRIPMSNANSRPVSPSANLKVRSSTPPNAVLEFKTPVKTQGLSFAISSPDPLAIQPSVKTNVVRSSNSIFKSMPNTPVTSSPDPLALLPNTSGSVTPQKRKLDVSVSPSLKRAHSTKIAIAVPRQNSVSSVSSGPLTPGGSIRPLKRFLGVEIPPSLKVISTPSTSGRSKSVPSSAVSRDLGGYSPPDSEWDEEDFVKKSVNKSSGKRTGDRDDRAPLEKLTAFIDDIFENEDSLPADISTRVSFISHEWFSIHSTNTACPRLSVAIIQKLTKLVSQVTRPRKRMRLARDAPRKMTGGLAEVDALILSRLMKILERSVKAGEDVDPFGHVVPTNGDKRAKVQKKAKGKTSKGKGKESENVDETNCSEAGGFEVEEQEDDVLTEESLQKMEKLLEVAVESVLAADCCIALLAADRLPKQLYSEELITSCLSAVKNQLTKVIYPFVEIISLATPGDIHTNSPPLLLHVAKSNNPSCRFYRDSIRNIFQALTTVIPRINALIGSEVAMSDSIVIQAVYIAIGPFFVVDPGIESRTKKGDSGNSMVLNTLGGRGAMRALRLEALSLIRSIFANHEEQRSWIIEEILTSLIKLPDLKQKSGQFKLRDGRSIHTVSALLLQLVQTSTHDVRLKAKRLSLSRQQSFVMKPESQGPSQYDSNEPFLNDKDHEEIQLYTSGLDSASRAAKTIVLFLTQRSGRGKATKSSNEAEYRAIFDNLISDLLTVLYWPEWPGAALLLKIICGYMISSLSDKSTSNTDNNAAKTLALDHLGVIASRIIMSSKNSGKMDVTGPREGLKGLDEIVGKIDIARMKKLTAVHQDISNHLSKRASEDQACDSARELFAVMWGHDLGNALLQCNAVLRRIIENDGDDKIGYLKLAESVKNALRNVWQEAAHDVFDIGSQEDVARIDRLSEELGTTQSLSNAFDAMLNVILASLDATAVFMRTKALRALGQIVTADPGILGHANVRKAIEAHLLDSSPQVRDAAVELIGKYVASIPEVAGDYYEQIADRIADTGLAVRKRVIKLLRTFYSVSTQQDRRVDICTKLVLRMNDEDESVRDLAMKTVEDIWFGTAIDGQETSPSKSVNRVLVSPTHERAQLLSKVSVIMGVSSQFRDRQSPLEDLLHRVIADKEGKEAQSLHLRYMEIGNTLIDCLVDDQELPGFTVVNCIKTIYLFVSAHPAIISTPQATTLLPYLKNATTPEEQLTSDYLLKIFKTSTPGMPKTATKFAHELQTILQHMLVKPSGPNWVATLQESVACICSVNIARMKEHLDRPVGQPMDLATRKKMNLQVFIAALLCEHCDFDKLRADGTIPATDVDAISKDSINEHIYVIMLRMYDKFTDPIVRTRLLDCLGFLFRAYPTLMTLETSATIMDAIFASPEEEARGRLLKIMQDFLITEAIKQSAQEKAVQKTKTIQTKVNLEELVGNTEGFADSGVSSAIVQRYLPQILEAAMTRNAQMQSAAVDILGFTCLPVIVALETSSNPHLSNRSSALHAILYTKHHSLMNTRHLECARASFSYQRKITQGVVKGYRLSPNPTALLHRWYTLVREKRITRQEFLRTMTKSFDLDPAELIATQDDVDFVRYMAENISAFDYKTQEEVLAVIRQLTSVLSVVGMALVETIAPTTLKNHELDHPASIEQGESHFSNDRCDATLVPNGVQIGVQKNLSDPIVLARCSVIIGIILILKSHLKSIYGLTEDKCSKWAPGKKSVIGDKPAVKRKEVPLVWDKMDYAVLPVRTREDADAQKNRFLELWAEDPVTAEPEDNDPMEL